MHRGGIVVLWASYYRYTVIRDVNPWFQKYRWRVNLFCNNVIITSWLKRRIRKFTFAKYSFFFSFFFSLWERTVTINLKIFSSNTILIWYTFGKFYIVTFNYFRGSILKIKTSLLSIKEFLYHLPVLGSYLSACNRGLFKCYYCYVLFLPFKKSCKYYEKYF